MMLKRPFLLFATLLALAACGDKSVRYVVDAAPSAASVRVRAGSIEVRDVILPAYAEAPEILQQAADGGLAPIKNAIWADGTAQALTATLAASLGARTTAQVAAEPWPLDGPADARVEVRFTRLIARSDATYVISGQFAVASPNGQLREFLQRFDITVPMAGQGGAAIADAKGRALDQLADQIAASLKR